MDKHVRQEDVELEQAIGRREGLSEGVGGTARSGHAPPRGCWLIHFNDVPHFVFAETEEDAVTQAEDYFGDSADELGVRRVPALDKYVGEELPLMQLIAEGTLWMNCPYCDVRVDELMYDFARERALDPVEVPGQQVVFCSPECLDHELIVMTKELH